MRRLRLLARLLTGWLKVCSYSPRHARSQYSGSLRKFVMTWALSTDLQGELADTIKTYFSP